MAVNIKNTKYTAKAILKDGSKLDITNAILSLSRQESAEEIAQRVNISLAQVKTSKGYLHSLLPLCTLIILYADKKETFRGIVWEWEYSSNSQNEIGLICYDHFIYAQKSKENAYYEAGKSTKDIISSICEKNSIKLVYSYKSIKHAKVLYKATAISEQILQTLEDAQSKLKDEPLSKPIARYDNGKLYITGQGKNKDVYVFDAKQNVTSTNERITMDNLVTRVVVVGKEDKQGRQKVEATLDGKTQYGIIQDMIQRDSDDTIAKAREEAKKIIEEQGTPKRDITVETVDVPFIKKGDKIKMSAGSLRGYYFVNGVVHDQTNRTMSMELARVKSTGK